MRCVELILIFVELHIPFQVSEYISRPGMIAASTFIRPILISWCNYEYVLWANCHYTENNFNTFSLRIHPDCCISFRSQIQVVFFSSNLCDRKTETGKTRWRLRKRMADSLIGKMPISLLICRLQRDKSLSETYWTNLLQIFNDFIQPDFLPIALFF